jgi:predicted ATPase
VKLLLDSVGGEYIYDGCSMSDSDQLLPPGLTGLLGGIRISGFEIYLPGRASQWLELDETLNILYGKNGVGKSSILEALSNFAKGIAFENDAPSARLFFTIDPFESFLDESINNLFDRSLLDPAGRGHEHWDPDPLSSPLPDYGSLLFNSPTTEQQNRGWELLTGLPKIPDLQFLYDNLKSILGSRGEELWTGTDDSKLTIRQVVALLIEERIKNESGPVRSTYTHTWPNWYHSYIRTCITTSLFGFTPKYDDLVDTNATWNCEGLPKTATILGIKGLDSDKFLFYELARHDFWSLLQIVLASRAIGIDFEKYPKLLQTLRMFVAGIPKFSFYIAPNEDESGHPWELGIRVEEEEVAKELLDRFGRRSSTHPSKADWMFYGIHRASKHSQMGVQLNLGIPIHKLPFVLADIRTIDKTAEQIKTLIKARKPHRFSNSKIDIDKVRHSLQELSSRTSNFIRQIGVQIDEVSIQLSDDPLDWALDEGIRIEAFDQHSQTWIRQDLLSEAQQRWIDYSFRLAHLTFYTSPLLILADEPDNGLHTTASRAALESLSTIGGTVIVASHSVAALRLNKGRIIHVQRDADGSTFIESINHDDGDLLNALKLGVDQSDLLALKRVAVFVEGNHDELVLRALLADQKNSIIDRIKFLPTRGEKQLTNSVDSQLILSYTNLDLVIVADNIRTEFFNGKISDLIAQQTAGVSIADLCRNLQDWRFRTLEKTKRGRINEERTMVDILDRAIRIGALNRIHIMGIEANDILESIPSSFFNLPFDWNELHRLHEQEKDRNLRESKESGSNVKKTGDFKTWISTNYSMKFTESVISDAFLRAFREGIPVELENLKVLLIALSSTPKVSDPSGLFN